MIFKEKKSIYQQIVENFCENIVRNRLGQGTRIASIRDESVRFGVNPNTMQRAYQFLQDNRIIESRRGTGYFVAHNGKKNATQLLRTRFEETEMPEIFRVMAALDIKPNDIRVLYEQYLSSVEKKIKRISNNIPELQQ